MPPSGNDWFTQQTRQQTQPQGVAGSGLLPSLGRKLGGVLAEDKTAIAKRNALNNQGGMASWFADQGQKNYGELGAEADRARQMLWDQATGKTSVTGEQLRQGLQSLYGQQRSMAASASPQNAAMAARTAMINSARLGGAASGQAALARLQEQQQAQRALQEAILGQRGQDQGVALGSRQNAIGAYGGVTPDKSTFEKLVQPVSAGLGFLATSDKREKKDIEDGEEKAAKVLRGTVHSDERGKSGAAGGDDKAASIMAGLKAYTFKYKDEKHGKGEQFGVMAQDLEKAGLGHAVIDMPDGTKAVHGAKLATANTAMLAALGKRVAKLEGNRK